MMLIDRNVSDVFYMAKYFKFQPDKLENKVTLSLLIFYNEEKKFALPVQIVTPLSASPINSE